MADNLQQTETTNHQFFFLTPVNKNQGAKKYPASSRNQLCM